MPNLRDIIIEPLVRVAADIEAQTGHRVELSVEVDEEMFGLIAAGYIEVARLTGTDLDPQDITTIRVHSNLTLRRTLDAVSDEAHVVARAEQAPPWPQEHGN